MEKSFSPTDKAAVAVAAIKGELTNSEISGRFSNKRHKDNSDNQKILDDLYRV